MGREGEEESIGARNDGQREWQKRKWKRAGATGLAVSLHAPKMLKRHPTSCIVQKRANKKLQEGAASLSRERGSLRSQTGVRRLSMIPLVAHSSERLLQLKGSAASSSFLSQQHFPAYRGSCSTHCQTTSVSPSFTLAHVSYQVSGCLLEALTSNSDSDFFFFCILCIISSALLHFQNPKKFL